MTGNTNNDMHALSCFVVEDNAFQTIEICKTLGSLGITQITTASNRREALETIDSMETPSAVILLDLRMPVMGGTEMLSRLADRKYNGWIIIVSGVDEETLHAVERLAHDHDVRLAGSLAKPPDVQALSNLLMKCID